MAAAEAAASTQSQDVEVLRKTKCPAVVLQACPPKKAWTCLPCCPMTEQCRLPDATTDTDCFACDCLSTCRPSTGRRQTSGKHTTPH